MLTQQELDKLNMLTQKYGYEFRSPREIKKYTKRVRRHIRKKCKEMKLYTTGNTVRIYQSWNPMKKIDNILIHLGLKKRYITINVKENKDNGK